MLKRSVLCLLSVLFLAIERLCRRPTDDVKKTVDEVVRIVSDKDMKKNDKNAARR